MIREDEEIIELIKNNIEYYKKYRDIVFLFKKIDYNVKRFEKELPIILKESEKISKTEAVNQIENFFGQLKNKPNLKNLRFTNNTVKLNISGMFYNPLFFYFDDIIIDSKRLLEFIIKFIAKILKNKEPKSIYYFFKGLKKCPILKERNRMESEFCNHMLKNYDEYCKYLIGSWDNWIKDLNKYRNDAIHESILNVIKIDVELLSSVGQSFKDFEIEEIRYNLLGREIKRFLEDILSNVNEFYNKGSEFIKENLK